MAARGGLLKLLDAYIAIGGDASEFDRVVAQSEAKAKAAGGASRPTPLAPHGGGHRSSSKLISAPATALAPHPRRGRAGHWSRFLAWWRQLKTLATSGSPQMRPCRQGASTPERALSLPLDEPVGLLGRVRREIRVRHYSYRTEQTYLHWIGRYLRLLAGQDVVIGATTGFRRFLEHLAVERRVSAATQNQAFNALLFLYREVLKIDLGTVEGITRARRSRRLPVVLTRSELVQLFAALSGIYLLMAKLMFGTGMRLMECCRLRVKDARLRAQPDHRACG